MANTAVLVRWVAWALLIGGVLMGGCALVSRPSAAVVPVRVSPAATSDGESALGPAGFAQLYVAAYLQAGEGSQSALAAFYPAAAKVAFGGKPGTLRAEETATVRFSTVGPGYWSVIVAAKVTGPAPAAQAPSSGGETSTGMDSAGNPSGGLRYFQVAVRAMGTSGRDGYVAVALPAEVSAPGHAGAPSLDYGPSTPAHASDPAVQTLQAFLGAYLTGAGELDRYLSPGTALSPVIPAPYTSVTVAQVAKHGNSSASGTATQAPSDGAQRHLLVDAVAAAADGQRRPLTYAVELKARAGRWEVAALEAAPDLSPGASVSAAPSTTAAPVPPGTTPNSTAGEGQ